MMTNWLAVAPFIAAQLMSVEDINHVRVVSGIPEAQALAESNFDVFIALGGDQPKDYAGSGAVVSVHQTWLVIVV